MLSVNKDTKTIKGLQYGYLTGILYLQPSIRTCPFATKGCRQACLNTAGMGRFDNVQQGRANKTSKILSGDLSELYEDISKLKRKAEKEKLIPCVRLNGTSDLDFSEVIEFFKDVQFYDYTKCHSRVARQNYHLTFSITENHSDDYIKKLVQEKRNAAIVFDEVPEEYLGIPVINGDEHDLRFLDPLGVIVGLKAKGRAKQDTTGFVRRIHVRINSNKSTSALS